jgi:uracil DNA glycosylase
MGCSVTNYMQPSLEQFYNAIERELFNGLTVAHVKNHDVSYLSHQGILMLNAGLTTEYMKAGSHNLLWETFMKFLFEQILGPSGVPIVFLGKESSKLEKYTMPFTWVFKVSHPASASYNATDWDSEGVFKSVNKILKERNNDVINWFELPDSLEEEEFTDDDDDQQLPF